MKTVLLMLLLLGGVVTASQAQRWGGHHREYRDDDRGYGRGRGHWRHRDRCDNGYYGRGYYYRPRRVVVYREPVYYRPYYRPAPVYYHRRPGVVVNAGITIVGR